MKNKFLLSLTSLLLVVFSLLFQNTSVAQSPHKMSFQSVIRNSAGTLIVNANVGVKLSVNQWTATGTTVYAERHTAWTNANGLVSLEMGTGATVIGTFSAMDWTNGPYFLKVEIDPTGGTSYTISSTTQLLSVPYAMYAAKAGSLEVGAGGDLSGTFPNPTVVKLQSKPISTTAPIVNDHLVWNGSAWTPTAPAGATTNYWTLAGSILYNNVGTKVGIGTTTPTYALHVSHGGGDGLLVKSSDTYSVVDIDAFSGDAALRYKNAGSIKWNVRNDPDNNNYQIVRNNLLPAIVTIANATGFVGITQATPTYPLDVLHTGGLGFRLKSSANSSILDIDAFSGDAALRFQKASVTKWNVRNDPTNSDFQILRNNSANANVIIANLTGYVGIMQNAPTYPLDVLHGGATGLRVKSSAAYSVIDIDAFDGDAALRFAKNGVIQWNVRNNELNDNLQFYETGVGERMRIDNTTGKVWVLGAFTALGAKAFTMDHPLDPENKFLAHAAAESNEVINFYSGNVVTGANGKVTVKLPDYFESINKDFRYQLTVIGAFAQAIISKEVRNNEFEISTSIPNVKVSWEVKGVRNDAYMKKHPFVAEEEKPADQKGKYIDPASHDLPLNMGIGFDASMAGESSTNYVVPVSQKAAPAKSGGSLDQMKFDQTKKAQVDPKGTSIEDLPKTEAKPVAKPAAVQEKSSTDK